MDLFKSQFDRVRQQLAGLTPSQKMLSAALVAIMVMTLVWFGRYAGSPEMVPLLAQSLSPDELGRIQMQLQSAGIPYKPSGDGKLLVPADRQTSAVATLSYSGALPKTITSGFDDVIKQLTAWDGQDRMTAVFNHGKELYLERIISAYPSVSSASVMIDPQFKRQIGRGDIEPTASVNLLMKDGVAGTKQMATACANLVAGAQAGMKPSQVTVVIDGKPFPIRGNAELADGGMDPGNLLETQVAAETLCTQKLEKHLGYIDGVRVFVRVQVNNASKSVVENAYNKDKSITLEQELQKQESEQTGGATAGGEPGVLANVQPVAVAGGGTGGGTPPSTTESKETIKNAVGLGMTRTETKAAAGEPTYVGASVRVPRSYFVLMAKGGDPAAKEPDQATLDKLIADEIPKIRKDVVACTGITAAGGITVEPYADLVRPARPPEVATASAVSLVVGGHAKEIALGGLALASLFMMSMIVRKGAPAVAAVSTPAAAAVAAAAAAARLEGGEQVAGEVAASPISLDGVELDDDALKAQQMLGQVTELVGDNPEAAATLIKRWMNQR
jgi:flagellar biosynthesis/type III secretory pathway M-ring protein FliF/YscJ